MRPATFERDHHESLLIVLDTLEKCLTMQANLHPQKQGVHGNQFSHMHSGNRGGIGRGSVAFPQVKSNKAGSAGITANVSGSSTPQGASNSGTEANNSMKEKETNASLSSNGNNVNNGSSVSTNAATISSNTTNTQPPAQKYDEIMNVKLLLKEICQFLDMPNHIYK